MWHDVNFTANESGTYYLLLQASDSSGAAVRCGGTLVLNALSNMSFRHTAVYKYENVKVGGRLSGGVYCGGAYHSGLIAVWHI